ncbi:DUF1672 family protein [Alkalicoccobacillus porphyridii]|uniref:DUF1672 family protein n=1 Tax=Alkalicoccobacillus porphyridii TaxID=2597270 RepID=UPI00163DCAA6|nr:DUF1672 family protein [Alkalicoccobacillus porphyridii]
MTNPSTKQPSRAEALDPFVPVQYYSGEGYTLDGGEVTQPIADENLPEIEEVEKRFFKDKYKTDVIVHNVVGANNAATLYVEAVGEVSFNTFAIIPKDITKEEVVADQIWVEEDQVEQAISGGINSLIYEEEISNLHTFIQEFAERNNLVGFNEKALENVRGTGFSTLWLSYCVYKVWRSLGSQIYF